MRRVAAVLIVLALVSPAVAAQGDTWILPLSASNLQGSGWTELPGAGYEGASAWHASGVDGTRRAIWKTEGTTMPATTELYMIEYFVPTAGTYNWQPIESQISGSAGEISPNDPNIPWTGMWGTNHQYIGAYGYGSPGTWYAAGPGPNAPESANYNAGSNGSYMWLHNGSWLYAKWDYGWGIDNTLSAIRLTQFTGGAIAPPGLPQIPPGYNMGGVVNGDFEAGGGSLAGWPAGYYGPVSQVSIYAPGGSEHTALLYAGGEWYFMPGPDPSMQQYSYESGSATMEQIVFVPLDATNLDFTYTTRSTAQLDDGIPAASITIGATTQTLPGAADWIRHSVSMPAEAKGKRTLIRFTVADNGSGYVPGWDVQPTTRNTMALYLDYVSLDGTTILQTTTWSANGGGTWEEPANWNPAGVPDNSTTRIHDVIIPSTASGSGDITLNSARTVLTLKDDRRTEALRIQSSGSLHIMENSVLIGATLQVAAGGVMTVDQDMTVAGGALAIHPDGDSAGALAMVVGGTLALSQDPVGLVPASVTVRDGALQAATITLSKAGLTVVNSAGYAGQSQVSTSDSIAISSNAGVILRPGTVLAPRYLRVDSSSGTLDIQASAIVGQTTDAYGSNYGTVRVTGEGCAFTQFRFYNYSSGQLLFADADMTFAQYLSNSGTMSLTHSSVTLEDDYQLGGTLVADAASTLIFKKAFGNGLTDPTKFDMKQATLRYTGATGSQMDVAGIDIGPFADGLDNNFGIGTLSVAHGTLQLRQNAKGRAQYVRDLVVMPGAALDLNNVTLYYVNSFTSQGGIVTGGQVRRAYPRPAGLPEVAFASDFIASVEACGTAQTVTGGPVQAYGSCGMGSNASSAVQAATGAGYRTITIDVSGSAYRDPWFPDPPPPFNALGSFMGGLTLAPTAQYPLLSPIDVLIRAGRSGYSGPQLTWSCKVFRNQEVLASFDVDHPESRLHLSVGEQGLRIEASISDGGAEYDSVSERLQIIVYSLPRSPRVDFDRNGTVDQDDLAVFLSCATGPSIPYTVPNLPTGCTLMAHPDGIIEADVDKDHDVDQDDFGLIQRCYSGPSNLADAACEN